MQRYVYSASKEPHYYRRNNAVTLLHDPTGDFARGAQFSLYDLVFGLQKGVWADGTQFKFKKRRLIIRGNHATNVRGGLVVLLKGVGR